MHLDDEQLQRVLDDELDSAAREVVEQHLATCDTCRARLAAARAEAQRMLGLLARLEAPVTAVTARDVIARAQPRNPLAAAWSQGAVRWAAGILAGVVIAGVAYTAPGSPLPRWVTSILGRTATRTPRVIEVPVPSTGIVVDPGDRFTVQFAAPQPSGVLTVGLTGDDRLEVQARRGLAPLTNGPGRLVIENQGTGADWEINVPAGAPWIEITIGDRRVFLKRGNHTEADVPFDAAGRYVIPLTGK